MRLVIHMGCHKTASTSFQRICSEITDELAASGILYDLRGGALMPPFQHSQIAWDCATGNHDGLRAILAEAKARGDIHTIFLSGEDFESFIVQVDLARRVEEVARAAGVDMVEWIIVHRPPLDYFDSLYAQVAGSPSSLVYRDAAEVILERGYLAFARLDYGWVYVFDIARYASRFAEAVAGRVRLIPFDRFVKGGAGRMLLDEFLGADQAQAALDALPREVTHSNQRNGPLSVEYRYAIRYLGYGFGPEVAWKDAILRVAIFPIVVWRVFRHRRARKVFAPRLARAFVSPEVGADEDLATEAAPSTPL